MNPDHTHFEILCALEASGQLTSLEMAELHTHSEGCSSCKNRLVDMTEISAGLFCAYTAKQSGSPMPKDMLVRFIARANEEGVPLNPRTESAGISGQALALASVFALLLVSVVLHFGSHTRTANEIVADNIASVSASMTVNGNVAPQSPAKLASGRAHDSLAASRQNTRGNGQEVSLLAHRANGRRWVPRVNSAALKENRFDQPEYPQTFTTLHLPFNITTNSSQNIQRAPARYGAPKFSFVEPLEFAKDDTPRLLAGYEPRFALWTTRDSLAFEPADVQVLHHDFNPDAYKTLLNPDFKQNLPAFQFSEDAQQ